MMLNHSPRISLRLEIRNWLIKKLAGGDPVGLNFKCYGQIETFRDRGLFFCNVHLDGSRDPENANRPAIVLANAPSISVPEIEGFSTMKIGVFIIMMACLGFALFFSARHQQTDSTVWLAALCIITAIVMVEINREEP